MKTLSKFMIVIAVSLSACKKDNSSTNNTPAAKTYLLSKITYHNPTYIGVEQYSYDEKNRVTEVYSTESNWDYKYTYDTNGNLLTATTYNINNSSLLLIHTDKYTYSGTRVTVQKFDKDGTDLGSYIFTLNSDGQAVSSTIDGTTTYTYDANKNLSGYSTCCSIAQSDSYSYDTKKHPLSMIAGNNLHLRFLALASPTALINNITRDNAWGANISYVYNSDGFPVSATMVSVGTPVTLEYEYSVK